MDSIGNAAFMGDETLVMGWAGFDEEDTTLQGLFELNKAADKARLVSALKQCESIAAAFVYATVLLVAIFYRIKMTSDSLQQERFQNEQISRTHCTFVMDL